MLDLVLMGCLWITLCIFAACGEALYMRCSAASFIARLGACARARARALPMREVCCLILLMQSLRSSCQCACIHSSFRGSFTCKYKDAMSCFPLHKRVCTVS